MSWSTLAKLVTPILQFVSYVKQKAGKNYSIHKSFKKLGILVDKSDFDSIYNQTLFDFENTRTNHPKLINLFNRESSKISFKNDYYNQTSNEFYNDLNTNLQVLEEYVDLKNSSINLQKEITDFIQIFSEKISINLLPKEKELDNAVKVVNLKLDDIKLFLSNTNSYLPDQLKEISELRQTNKHKIALELLVKYKNKHWNVLSDELKFGLTLNLASTYFEIGEKQKGAKYFTELIDFNFNKEDGLGYAALGFAILGDSERSIDYANKAIHANPNNIKAYLGLLFSKEETLEVSELDDLIPIHIQQEPEVAINIATFLEKKKEYERAFEIFNKLNDEHPQLDLFKCDILVQLANNKMMLLDKKDDFFFNQLDEPTLENVKYAIEKFETAWNYLKNSDLKNSRWYILTNKGIAYRISGDPRKAEEDFKASLEINENYITYKHLLLLRLDKSQNYGELISKIEKLSLTDSQMQELTIYKAEQLFSDSKPEEALSILLEQLPNIKADELERQYLSMITETYLKLKNYSDAEKYALQFAEKYTEDPVSFYNLSRIAFATNNNEPGNIYLQKSKSFITKSSPRFIAILIADKFSQLGDFKSSSEILELVANVEVLSTITRKLINALYLSGNHKKAMEISQNLLQKLPDDPFLIDLISAIYETNQQYDNAIDTITSYIASKPDEKFMLVKLSINYYKKEDFTNGVKVLDTIVDYSDIPLDVQFLIADAYLKNKNYEKGLELAYQLRAKNYSDPSCHTKYVQCVIGKEDLGSEVYYPPIVKNNCYVVLNTKSGKRVEFIIVDNAKYQHEISNDEPVATLLMDKPLNSEIELNGENFIVESIVWKYTHALHDSMEQLSLRFGNTEPIKVFKIKEGATPREQFSDIFNKIDEAHDFDKQMEELYVQGKSTIGVNAELSGINPLKYWGKLVSSWNSGINSIGTRVEFQIALQLLSNQKHIIFDITSLLTLRYIEGFELLSKINNKKYVSQSTLDVIENEISDIENRIDTETLIVNKIGAQYVRHIVTTEEKKEQVEGLKKFLDNIKIHVEILNPEMSEDYSNKKEKDKLFGKCFNETVIIAKESDCIIFSDDVFFRQLAYNEYQINGVSSFNFLIFLELQNLIESTVSANYLEKLIKLNYRNIPSNAKILYKVLQDSGYMIRQPFINACDFIHPNFINDVTASKVIVEFLLELYISTTMTVSKSFVTEFIFKKLFEGRNSTLIKRYLIAILDTKFNLLPINKNEILQILRTY